MKIELTLPLISGDDITVEAELLPNIAPHLARVSTYALHRVPYWKGWSVSSVETGHYVSKDLTRAGAIKKAAQRLSDKTPKQVLATYRKALKAFPQCGAPL